MSFGSCNSVSHLGDPYLIAFAIMVIRLMSHYCSIRPGSTYLCRTTVIDPVSRKRRFCEYLDLHLHGAVCLQEQYGYSHHYQIIQVAHFTLAVHLLQVC